MKYLLQIILRAMAKAVLVRYRPLIVAITGSVGKTTTREAAAVVLSAKFRVRQSIKSYNNEIGVPLTVLGVESAGRSLGGWVRSFGQWVWLMTWGDRSYPEVLVLEMGADHPGDIAYLVGVATPSIGVLTAIGPAHLEKFGSLENIAKEKRTLIAGIRPGGWAVLNADDVTVVSTKVRTGVERKTYGTDRRAGVRATDITMKYPDDNDGRAGVAFKVTVEGSSIPVFLHDTIGTPIVSAALAAIAVGLCAGVNVVAATQALASLQPTPGRLRVLPGRGGATLLDDSYNASPRAVVAALDVLDAAPATSRHIAVLGDMLELGETSAQLHEEIGRMVAERSVAMLATVGENARAIGRAARLHGMDPSKIFCFARADEAGQFLQEQTKPGDIILIKGSQGVRLERAVAMMLAEAAKPKEVLVRQDALWANK